MDVKEVSMWRNAPVHTGR